MKLFIFGTILSLVTMCASRFSIANEMNEILVHREGIDVIWITKNKKPIESNIDRILQIMENTRKRVMQNCLDSGKIPLFGPGKNIFYPFSKPHSEGFGCTPEAGILQMLFPANRYTVQRFPC